MESILLTAEDVAKQLRIKKYTVYELIKRGELPSSKVGKQVRISQEDINRYLQSRKTGFKALLPERIAAGPAGRLEDKPPVDFPGLAPIIICGQDKCLDLLVSRISRTGTNLVLRSFMGSYNGLCTLYNGRVTMAAAHLWDGETDTYNYPFIRHLLPGLPVGVLRLAGRMQGFYVKKGNPLQIKDWNDLARREITMINRERGCGTRILLDQKVAQLGIDTDPIQGYTKEYTSHLACANTVARGEADLGCGCEGGREHIPGVDFVPLQLEWYDFIFRLADRNTPALRTILSYVLEGEFRQDLEMLGPYDLSQTGRYETFYGGPSSSLKLPG
ncbi:MAG: helix-turn-helix transcriptional regulator [Treponema sp.]|jgi:putative molybdopterin biosynthesis protein|nr:helix-turn-helix transcriptional regulator [Treponema sp.]